MGIDERKSCIKNIDIIKDICNIRTYDSLIRDFFIMIGLKLALNPFLFVILMDKLTSVI